MSERYVYWTNLAVGRAGKIWCFAFECSLDFETLIATLNEGKVVSGHRLWLVDDGRGGKLIRGRDTVAIAAGGIASINPYHLATWEPEDA